MKVAMLSFHNAYNYGAALQAYALQCAIEEMGVQCEYINYTNEHRKNAYDMSYQFKEALQKKNVSRAVRVMIGAPFIKSRGAKFNRFYSEYLKKTSKVYHSSSEARELNGLYDKFIVGSDQVWNTENNGSDTAYLLDFVDDSQKKISYSSSFGMDSVPENFRERYREHLLQIERLAVRENVGVKIVKDLTGRDAHLVLDPVFLIGVDRWNKLRHNSKNSIEKYVFFYTNNGSQIKDFLSTGYSMEGIKSHVLSSYVTPKDFIDSSVKVRVSMSPNDFLNEVASAEIVVTASFHCLAFAILFHKPFCVILTGNRGKDERLLNLLKITELESRIIDSDTTVDQIQAEIDYDHVDSLLKPYLDYSKEYLRRAVFSEKDIEHLQPVCDDNDRYFCQDMRCYGCTACEAVCPVNAIKMKPDKEGFLSPIRDTEKCIECSGCHNVCQIFCEREKIQFSQEYYAVKNDDSVREKSSSGGVFTAVSDVILEGNGAVVAACMCDDFSIKHTIIENSVQRDSARGTYYVQSNLGDTFVRVKNILKSGKKVLFVGTPCQVQGLKNYIGTESKLLYTCDLVCHGVPSPYVFERFINYIREHGCLTQFKFRDKSLGWKNGYTVSAIVDGKKVSNTLWMQSFLKMFSKSMINRRSCANCQYTSYDRVGDITIGDFWKIEKSRPDFKDNLGVSLLLINTEKGKKLVSQSAGLTMIPMNIEDTFQNSLMHPSKPSPYRIRAFRTLCEQGYEETAKKYGGQNIKGWVKEQIRRIRF